MQVCEVSTGRIVLFLQGHRAGVFSVAFSPDGYTIFSGSRDKTVRLWDLQGNPIGQPFQGHGDWAIVALPNSKDRPLSANNRLLNVNDRPLNLELRP